MRSAVLIVALLACASAATAQPEFDPEIDFWKVRDPLANRLFLMPTGRLVQRDRLLVGTLGPFGMYGTYAPNSFMQFNFGTAYSPFRDYYTTIMSGVKVRVARPDRWFQGVALNADLGLFYSRNLPFFRGSLLALGLSTSFGNANTGLHLAATTLPVGTPDGSLMDVDYLLQAGGSVLVYDDRRHAVKLIAEGTWGGRDLHDVHAVFVTTGLRDYTRRRAFELGMAWGPRCFGECGNDGSLLLYGMPYFSVTLVP